MKTILERKAEALYEIMRSDYLDDVDQYLARFDLEISDFCQITLVEQNKKDEDVQNNGIKENWESLYLEAERIEPGRRAHLFTMGYHIFTRNNHEELKSYSDMLESFWIFDRAIELFGPDLIMLQSYWYVTEALCYQDITKGLIKFTGGDESEQRFFDSYEKHAHQAAEVGINDLLFMESMTQTLDDLDIFFSDKDLSRKIADLSLAIRLKVLEHHPKEEIFLEKVAFHYINQKNPDKALSYLNQIVKYATKQELIIRNEFGVPTTGNLDEINGSIKTIRDEISAQKGYGLRGV